MTLLGPLAIRIGPRRQKIPFAGRTRRLFIFLAGHANVSVRRERLLDELWPDVIPERATSGLNTAIWRIKQGLSSFPGFAIETVDDVIRLAVDHPARIDCHILESCVSEATCPGVPVKLPQEHYLRLLTIVKNCCGPFLDGCSDHWVLPLREKFGALHVRALTLLMRDRAARGKYDAALEHGCAILELDAFREGTQREVMWLYALNGQRAQAIMQFRMLSNLLEHELGIDPMPETVALYQKIAHAQDSIADLARLSLGQGRLDPALVPAVCVGEHEGIYDQ